MPVVLVRYDPADWLPEYGIADVIRAEPGDPPPNPVGLVRLLVTDPSGRVFCVPRTGGRHGWDLPTARVGDEDASRAVRRLVVATLGRATETDLVGYVRNVVPDETTYEWPAVAHFAVYRPRHLLTPCIEGAWLDVDNAADELANRHWWPLHAVSRSGARRLHDRLVEAVARWTVTDGDRELLMETAVDALVVGLDTPSLRDLAGIDRLTDWADVDRLAARTLDELGHPAMTPELALRKATECQARRVLDGILHPHAFTTWAHAWVRHDGPDGLAILAELDDEYDILEDVPGDWSVPDRPRHLQALDATVRAAAAALLAGEPDLTPIVREHRARG